MNKKIFKLFLIFVILALLARGLIGQLSHPARLISLAELDGILPELASAQIDADMLLLSTQNGQKFSIYASSQAVEKILAQTAISGEAYGWLSWLLLGASIGIFVMILLYRTAKNAEINPPKEQQFEPKNIASTTKYVSFDEVLGAHVAKRELRKLISQLHANAPMKALLFSGASGVGKTMLARALASAANCAFSYASASSFNELYVGMGAKRVRELFAEAAKISPCIIFIDEIDALGAARGNLLNKESEHTLNELLVQMDGFATRSGILLIAATNRADVLDPALLRRFAKKIEFSLPNEAERAEFVRAYKISPALDEKEAIALTNGFSGADFAAVAAELNEPNISKEQVLRAIAERRFGLASTAAYSQQLAYSQAGTLVVAKLLGAEVYHVAGRVIWQLNLMPSRARAFSQAQILLAANEATKIIFEDEYEFNKSAKSAAANALKDYIAIDTLGIKNELEQLLEDAAAAAAHLLQMHREKLDEYAQMLSSEAEPFVEKL